ncbi:conserved hypothetical protein [Oenococcus oeni]|nr:conserved hypothetical protein [Oenococcus oeni]SYW11758.1 conserved hypothetical protein [Oenococcus oeni]SYW15650.1 conserved hypothetical protein [Oenococcus oeni]
MSVSFNELILTANNYKNYKDIFLLVYFQQSKITIKQFLSLMIAILIFKNKKMMSVL